MWVPVGLFGLQTISSWVAAVTSARHRVEVVDVALGERHADLAGARVSAGRYGYIENAGQA